MLQERNVLWLIGRLVGRFVGLYEVGLAKFMTEQPGQYRLFDHNIQALKRQLSKIRKLYIGL